MSQFEVGGSALGKVHRAANDKKFYCYFTGFLEGIVASGNIEAGEVEPLIRQCEEFVNNKGDDDAIEILEDFDADLLEHASLLDAVKYRAEIIDPKCEKSSVNRFLGFCAGVACDDVITEKEAERLVQYSEKFPNVVNDSIARALVRTCIEALDDGVIEPEESAAICQNITRLVGDAYCDTGISSLGNTPVLEMYALPENDAIFENAYVVLTGAFSISPRRLIEEELEARGAVITKTVSKKTSFVIIASEASRDWVHTHKGTKMIKALSLREEGGLPDFVAEADLLRLLELK